MYMQFEEAGLIRETEEYERRMEERIEETEKEPVPDQSYRLSNNM